MNLGLIFGEPSDFYHATDAVSSSKLADIRIAGKICPANYYARHVAKTVERKKGDHFDFGIATHAMVLEGPIAYHTRTALQPTHYKNDKGEMKPWHNGADACKTWHAVQAETGKIVLSNKEAQLIIAMNGAIDGHEEARTLLKTGVAEVTFRKVIAGTVHQCRVDKWHANGVLDRTGPIIVDLKTCASIERFEREFYALRYNVRSEYYRLVIREVLAEMGGIPVDEVGQPTYLFVVVEKSAPYRVKVFEPDEESLDAGRKEVHADLLTLRNCQQSGKWPTGCEGIHSIGLNTWQLAKSIETSDAAIETS